MKKTTNSRHKNKGIISLLFVCFTLLIGISGCNRDNDETVTPQTPMDDASLLASQMKFIKAKAGDATTTIMVTTNSVVTLAGRQNSVLTVEWGDATRELITDTSFQISHTYTDNLPVHTVLFYGSNTALEELMCSSNSLLFLDISRNINITRLNCLNNRLDSLNLSQNTKLEYLIASDNHLSTIDVSQNPALYNLGIGNNQLNFLDVSQNTKLEVLYIQNINISSLDITENSSLIDLNCMNNNLLSSLDISQNTKLISLNFSHCKVAAINLSQSLNTELSTINCIGSPLSSDFNLALSMASNLPDRAGKTKGKILGINCPNKNIIQSIGDVRYWTVY